MHTAEKVIKKELQLNSNPCNIVLVEPFVEEFRANYAIGDDVYCNMLVAITEAVNNAIVHGNLTNENKQVKLQLQKLRNKVTCTIQDEGSGFDYNNLPDPTAPENIENCGGRGVFLMKQLSDMVIFSNDGCLVEIQFKL